MSGKFFIGIDGGTQSTKVVIYDNIGNAVADGQQQLKPLLIPKPGIVLHPDDDLWDSLVIAMHKALKAFDGTLSDIAGIGLCTIRCCRTVMKLDGSLAYPVMSWMDLRLSKPYEHEDPEVKYVSTTSGYITHRLTGLFRDTCANYEGEWPIDKRKWDWSDDYGIMSNYNIPREMLCDLVKPGELLGNLTDNASETLGLPKGLPVYATASDKAVEALGSGPLSEEIALVSLGTYIAAMIEGHELVPEAEHFFTNLACEPFKYIYESTGIRRGMWTVSWIRDLLGSDIDKKAHAQGISPENYLNSLAKDIPAGCEGLITIPEWLAPPSKLYKRGIMLGFNGRHTGIHMYRSILESIALTMYNNTMSMCRERDKKIRKVIISGGGSKGDLFMQIFADVFNMPSVRNKGVSAVSLGSAICAAAGSGEFGSIKEAASAMVHREKEFEPSRENAELYMRMNNDVYKHITERTDEVLKLSYQIFG